VADHSDHLTIEHKLPGSLDCRLHVAAIIIGDQLDAIVPPARCNRRAHRQPGRKIAS
jgi:hypothetical protein